MALTAVPKRRPAFRAEFELRQIFGAAPQTGISKHSAAFDAESGLRRIFAIAGRATHIACPFEESPVALPRLEGSGRGGNPRMLRPVDCAQSKWLMTLPIGGQRSLAKCWPQPRRSPDRCASTDGGSSFSPQL
jgi:hypothetical protein